MDTVVLQERQDKTVGREPEGDHHIHHGLILFLHFHSLEFILFLLLQVEDFWALYNHIELASRLAAGCDYSLFKVSHFCQIVNEMRKNKSKMIHNWTNTYYEKSYE